MYEQFFNFLGLREDPFHVSPDPRFFYNTPSHEAALAELLYGIEMRKGFMVLTGEAGTGKTSLLKQILDWLKGRRRSTAYIFHTHVGPIGLLKLILNDFGAACYSRSKSELITTLHTWLSQRHAAGDLPVLILDEAQALPMQTLDELRLLLNLETPRGKLLQIVLSGQPELEDKLRLPELRQLRQRIVFHSRLELLSQKQTAQYISRRLAVAGCPDSLLFPKEVVHDIYTSSRGIPRVVNLLCEHALISAYAERQHVVSPEMVQKVAADFDLLEKPLAVPESELQGQYDRSARFPLMEETESSSALDRDSMRWLDQIEFDVSTAPMASTCKWPLSGVQEKQPAPEKTSTAVAAAESPRPLECPTETPIARGPSPTAGYWRSHRSLVRKFLRTSRDSMLRAWDAITSSFDVAKARLTARFERTKPAIIENPAAQITAKAAVESAKPAERPIGSSNARSSADPGFWRTHRSLVTKFLRDSANSVRRAWRSGISSLDLAKTRLALLVNSLRTAVKQNSVPQITPKASVDAAPKRVQRPMEAPVAHSATPALWRNLRSRPATRTFARNSVVPIRRGWHVAVDPVLGYARPVLHSFVRDCQSLFHLVTPPTPALEVGTSSQTGHGRSANRRGLSPVLNWFRQPMTVRRTSNHRASATPAARKKA